MKIKYHIMINEQQDPEGRHVAMWDGYKPGDPLTEAWTDTEDFSYLGEGEAEGIYGSLDICEVLFERFNVDHPAGYHNRSLSVGDVIILEDQRPGIVGDPKSAYAVAPVGFHQIELPNNVIH
jgi:hypothetical protein